MFKALLRGIKRGGGGGEVDINANRHGDLLIASGLPPYTEMTRQGKGWQAMTTSAVACLIARPGVTALLTLWNGEEGGGPSYVIDRLFAQQLVSAAAAARWGLWACLHQSMAAVDADITAIKGLSGKANYGGKARLDVGATVVDDGWFPFGEQHDVEATGTLGGGQVDVRIEGRLIIPPQHGLSLHGVASSVDVDLNVGFAWYEVQLDLE